MRAKRPPMTILVLVMTVVGLCSLPFAAFAQGEEADERAEEARRLFQLGSLHFDGDEFEQAANMFERAYALDPMPELALNAALAWESAGDVQAARAWFIETLDTTDSGDIHQRAERGRDRMDAILANIESSRPPEPDPVTRLVVTSTPAGATITVDDVPYGFTPLELEVNPGSRRVEVDLDGYESASVVIDIEEGTRVNVPLTLYEQRGSNGVTTGPVRVEERAPWAPMLISASVGLAGLGLGIGFGLAAESDRERLDDLEVRRDESRYNAIRDDAKSNALLSNVGYGVAIAGLVGTITIALVQRPWRREERSMSVAFRTWGRGGAVEVRF